MKEPPYRQTGVDLEWREAASGKFMLQGGYVFSAKSFW
jgi:hypothetical protein